MENSYFPRTLLQRLNKLRQQGQLCDVTISVNRRTFHAHKTILAACSDYFCTMFTSGFTEKSSSEITIGGSSGAFEILLDFAYTGQLNTVQTALHMYDVLDLACYTQFTEFAETVSDFLIALLKLEPDKVRLHDAWRVCELASKVDHYNLEDLVTASLSYLENNVESLKNLDVFLENADVAFLLEFLDREELSNQDEEKQILEMVCNWLHHDWPSRGIYSSQLLRKVRLGLVSSDDINSFIGQSILGIKECADFISHALQLQASEAPRDTLAVENPDLFMTRSAVTAPIVQMQSGQFTFYNYQAHCWMDMEKMDILPSNAQHVSTAEVRGTLYAAGGMPKDSYQQDACCRDFYSYSPWDNKWYPLQAMTTGRFYFPLVILDGYIYAIGGLIHSNGVNAIGQKGTYPDSNLATNKVERYDIATNRWEDVASLPRECHRLSATVFKDNIIVYGMKRYPYRYPRYSQPYQRHLPHGQRVMITEHFVMIYQPDRDEWQLTDLGGQESFATWERSELYCHKGRCYRLVFGDYYNRLISVKSVHLHSDDKGTIPGTMTVTIGEEVEQDHIPPDQGALRIGDEVFVLISRFVWATNIRISSHQSGEVDLGIWKRRDRHDRYYKDVESGNVTLLSFDKIQLSNCNKKR